MNRTLIITGIYKSHYTKKVDNGITTYKVSTNYTVDILGQCEHNSLCTFIKSTEFIDSSYEAMIEECKNIYAKYFNIDLFNIVTIDRLHNIETINEII